MSSRPFTCISNNAKGTKVIFDGKSVNRLNDLPTEKAADAKTLTICKAACVIKWRLIVSKKAKLRDHVDLCVEFVVLICLDYPETSARPAEGRESSA
ncbi:hypothetical protein NDU88_000281 [Pleurodeles waltl]|uniref:Uncharacterized protein n=1 Tax=Pleurodeles waltl TaxID=8319 RepID=A0AAV7S7B7_PLEWA|nr:hypothetical protein NDU88_000281 [Pleurodeles waltl]